MLKTIIKFAVRIIYNQNAEIYDGFLVRMLGVVAFETINCHYAIVLLRYQKI